MVAGQSGLDSEIAYKHGDEVVLSEYENVLAGTGRFAVPRGQGTGWQAVLRSILAQSGRGPMVVDGTGFRPCSRGKPAPTGIALALGFGQDRCLQRLADRLRPSSLPTAHANGLGDLPKGSPQHLDVSRPELAKAGA